MNINNIKLLLLNFKKFYQTTSFTINKIDLMDYKIMRINKTEFILQHFFKSVYY